MVMEQLLDDCNLIEFDCRDDELNDFIINDDAIPFYEKLGMKKSDEVMEYSHVEWTEFTVE